MPIHAPKPASCNTLEWWNTLFKIFIKEGSWCYFLCWSRWVRKLIMLSPILLPTQIGNISCLTLHPCLCANPLSYVWKSKLLEYHSLDINQWIRNQCECCTHRSSEGNVWEWKVELGRNGNFLWTSRVCFPMNSGVFEKQVLLITELFDAGKEISLFIDLFL